MHRRGWRENSRMFRARNRALGAFRPWRIVLVLCLVLGGVAVGSAGRVRDLFVRKEYRTTTHEGRPAIMWECRRMWTETILEAIWYDEVTGMQVRRFVHAGGEYRDTLWTLDGSVRRQAGGSLIWKEEPPWWWGETDQGQPNAPWVLEGQSLIAWLSDR